MYAAHAKEFPTACKEGEYERRIQKAYPIHPELFDRPFGDWSSLDKFQMTRGVLRLMAAVIHTLWQRGDADLLILPATVPIEEPAVRDELMRYLDDPWRPVIENDVDGPNSVPLRMDQDNPALARFSACRRVARTVFMGSAPKAEAAARGLEDIQISSDARSQVKQSQHLATLSEGSPIRPHTFIGTAGDTATPRSPESAVSHEIAQPSKRTTRFSRKSGAVSGSKREKEETSRACMQVYRPANWLMKLKRGWSFSIPPFHILAKTQTAQLSAQHQNASRIAEPARA